MELKKKGENNYNNLDTTQQTLTTQATNKKKKTDWFFENGIEREWLKTEEAAHFLSVTPNAIRIMVHRGQIRAYKFGSRLRFKRDDCRALFKMKGV